MLGKEGRIWEWKYVERIDKDIVGLEAGQLIGKKISMYRKESMLR